MKHRLLLFAVILLSTYRVEAQNKVLYYSTSYKQECWWNETSQKYDNCTGKDEGSLFRLNADQTMFHHTTDKLVSDYYVTHHEYDATNDVYTYDVKSDAGNTYFFIIDVKNNQIRIVGSNQTSDNKTYMNVYTIKNSWSDDQ